MEATFISAAEDTMWVTNGALERGYHVYAIRDATTQNSIPCADEATPEMREQCVDHVAYSIISGGLEANIRLLGTLWFTTWAGQTLYRRFEQRNTASEVVEGGLQSLPNEYFVRAGITWRIPME